MFARKFLLLLTSYQQNVDNFQKIVNYEQKADLPNVACQLLSTVFFKIFDYMSSTPNNAKSYLIGSFASNSRNFAVSISTV